MGNEHKHCEKMILFAQHQDAEVWCKGVGEDKSKYQIVTGYSPNWRDDWDYEVVLPPYEQAFVWWLENRLQVSPLHDVELWADSNTLITPSFDMSPEHYREKPERLVIFSNIYDDGTVGTTGSNRDYVASVRVSNRAGKTLRFVQEDE